MQSHGPKLVRHEGVAPSRSVWKTGMLAVTSVPRKWIHLPELHRPSSRVPGGRSARSAWVEWTRTRDSHPVKRLCRPPVRRLCLVRGNGQVCGLRSRSFRFTAENAATTPTPVKELVADLFWPTSLEVTRCIALSLPNPDGFAVILTIETCCTGHPVPPQPKMDGKYPSTGSGHAVSCHERGHQAESNGAPTRTCTWNLFLRREACRSVTPWELKWWLVRSRTVPSCSSDRRSPA